MRSYWWAILLAACDGTAATADAVATGDDAQVDAGPPTRLVAYISGGPDIAWYDVDKATGALTSISSVAAFRTGASFLAFHGDYLYAIASGDRVGAYSIDPATASITFINDVAAGGSGPAHVSVDQTGAFVLVANYNAGNVSVMRVQSNGGLGAAIQTVASGANAHLIATDPTNHYVFVPCLGADKVAQYTFSTTTGMLTPNTTPQLDTATGAGPRHLAFAPNGKHAYLINELNSTLSALSYNSSTGRLTELQTVSTRASSATGTNSGAEVVVHPNGRFVYGSNRGDNNIAVFAIDATSGMVTLIDNTSTQGMTPRNFTVDPSGKYLYAANQNSGTVVPFAIDASTGRLTPTATAVTAQTPQFVGIIALPL